MMQNKLSSIGAELEKDRCKGVEIRELNDKGIFRGFEGKETLSEHFPRQEYR